MKAVKIEELKPGITFSAPVYVDGENLFIPEDIPVREKDILRLKKWQVKAVFTEGEMINPNDGSALFRSVPDTPEQRETVDAFSKILETMRQVFKGISEKEDVDTQKIDNLVDVLISLLENRKNETIKHILYGVTGEGGYAENSVNCAVFSLMIAQNMGVVQHKMIQLATGALLHDVGMLRMPEKLLVKRGKLDRMELQTMKTHTVHTYKIITKELKYPEAIGQIGLQHHERWDGEGYPKSLSGGNITLAARIVAVADAFEAMISERPYRSPMIGYTAMRAILSDNSRRFDPEVLKAFIKSMGIYPIGSIVLLNDASIGRVQEHNPASPLRPAVKILIDSTGKRFDKDDGGIVDLQKNRKLFIAKAVNPKDLVEKMKK
jgi:HD-GYP domain-containing protein (c-di-GMP phosphodiesterase class II)